MSPQCLLTPFTTTLLADDRVPAVISFSFVEFHIEIMKYLLVQVTVWGLMSMGCGWLCGVQQSRALCRSQREGAQCPTREPAAMPLPARRRAGPVQLAWPHCWKGTVSGRRAGPVQLARPHCPERDRVLPHVPLLHCLRDGELPSVSPIPAPQDRPSSGFGSHSGAAVAALLPSQPQTAHGMQVTCLCPLPPEACHRLGSCFRKYLWKVLSNLLPSLEERRAGASRLRGGC